MRHAARGLAGLGLGLLALAALAFAAGEALGWPFLVGPLERVLAARLQRRVTLRDEAGAGFALQLLGSVRIQARQLTLAGPTWGTAGPMARAENARITLRYRDLLATPQGAPLRIEALTADALELKLERLADGRASWQFAAPEAEPINAAPRFAGIAVGRFAVQAGRFSVADAPLALTLQGRFATHSDSAGLGLPWQLQATGRRGAQAVQADLRSAPALTWLAASADAPPVAVRLALQVGQAHLNFLGEVQDALGRGGLAGEYRLAGPSLAAVGLPLGLALPATPRFELTGTLLRREARWHTRVQQATIGSSRLSGEFVLDRGAQPRPLLTGTLMASRLWLGDLGPAIGAGTGGTDAIDGTPPAGKVLPVRRFDLPALTLMDARVQADVVRLDLADRSVEPVSPLRLTIALQGGELRLQGIDARVARGRVTGQIVLDGGNPERARWQADLRLSGLRLEQWIAQRRAAGQPPYASGRLAAHVQLAGVGRSTAELLASAEGRAWVVWSEGRLSHLAVEAAGIDVAQALGVLVRGDDGLAVSCGAADLTVRGGRVTPGTLLVDTTDSTLWATGQASLADEQLDLVLHVEPKDFSPLALRTPVLVKGSFAHPSLSLEKTRLLQRLLPAALLAAAVSPLAALLPLLDTGDDEARPAIQACRALLTRLGATPGV